MSFPKNLVGFGGTGIAQAVNAALQAQNVSVAGGAANAALPVPGLVTGQQLMNTLALDANGKPLSPQPVFTVTYGAAGAESTIASPTATTGGTVRVTYGPSDGSANITYTSNLGNGLKNRNAVPAPALASPSGYQADLGAIEADAAPQPGAEVLPVANFTSVVNHESVAFTDTTSYTDGAANERFWDFGDGVGTSNVANPTYVYAQPGTYEVTLEITDANGHQSEVTQSVTSVA